MKHSVFVAVYAEECLTFMDTVELNDHAFDNIYTEHQMGEQYNTNTILDSDTVGIENCRTIVHLVGKLNPEFGVRPQCIICKIENNWNKKLKKIHVNIPMATNGNGTRSQASMCQCKSCFAIVHCCVIERAERKIEVISNGVFKGMTCWEIAHHRFCKGLFRVETKTIMRKQTDKVTKAVSTKTMRCKYLKTNTSHKGYKELMDANNITHKRRTVRCSPTRTINGSGNDNATVQHGNNVGAQA